MLENKGEIEFPDDANIPVVCFLTDPNSNDEDYPNKWRWTASNFMPRKELVVEGAYELVADSKKEIMDYIKKYVLPLYKTAVRNLEETGENYYWHVKAS